MAGAAEIPATKLFGRSPQGLNATGESDLKNYYEKISQLQETVLRPALERLLPVMEISAFGYFAPDSEIVFEPIATTTPQERVEILSRFADTVIRLHQAGLISRPQSLAELKSLGRDLGFFSALEEDDPSGPDEQDPETDPEINAKTEKPVLQALAEVLEPDGQAGGAA